MLHHDELASGPGWAGQEREWKIESVLGELRSTVEMVTQRLELAARDGKKDTAPIGSGECRALASALRTEFHHTYEDIMDIAYGRDERGSSWSSRPGELPAGLEALQAAICEQLFEQSTNLEGAGLHVITQETAESIVIRALQNFAGQQKEVAHA